MGKTKEEITTITTKNYFQVQKQELESLEALQKHHEAFKKDTRASFKEYTELLKSIKTEEAETLKQFDANETSITARHTEHLKQIEINKNDSSKQLEKEQKLHQKEYDKALKDLDKSVEKIETTLQTKHVSLDESLANDLDKSKKNILDIEEKGVKDEATFTQKLADLEVKYNEKIEALNTKEASKIEKLTESSTKKAASLEEMIAKELAKHQKALDTKKALFEEELEEIDEKIAFEKSEFETKYQNIKDSVEKRVAVREKHLQRALNDNDKRSAKQHKKDIAKFRKEADTDLVVLEKNYNQKAQASADYRLKFIKDYHEDLAQLQEQFETYKEEKHQAIELVKAELTHDVKTTKFDYDQLRAKELNEYNESFAQIREKQETAKMQRQLAVDQENHNQALFALEHKKALALSEKEQEESLETIAKERRVLALQKQKDDDLSDNTYQEALVRLDAEGEVANMEQARDLLINDHNRQIAVHGFQHKRHTGLKDEFTSYQQHIGPLFLNRSRDIKAYEEEELSNRLNLKLAFYDKMRADVEKDYETLKSKVDETHTEEAAFLQEKIEELAGSKTEELNEFVQSTEARLRELKTDFEPLTEFKDRKERKQKEQVYEKEFRLFQDEKSRRETELNQQVGAYKSLLANVNKRHENAHKDIKEAYDRSLQLIQTAVDRIKENTASEQQGAANFVETTDSIFQQFNLQAASRSQQQTDAHTAYHTTQVEREQNAIKEANVSFDRNRDLLNDDMQARLSELTAARQDIASQFKSALDKEEQALEQFKTKIKSEVATINGNIAAEINAQTTAFTTIKNDLSNALNAVISQIKSTFQTQTTDFNQTIDAIQKNISAETALFDSEQRRIKKESGERLKETIRHIKSSLQQELQNI